jgi:hypothetical protein
MVWIGICLGGGEAVGVEPITVLYNPQNYTKETYLKPQQIFSEKPATAYTIGCYLRFQTFLYESKCPYEANFILTFH